MKKLLYIVANSKPEEISSSKTVGRALVKYKNNNCSYEQSQG